ncbi:MAG: ABC transporter permease subunit, partial [Chloroflexi bacterium]
VYFAVRWALPQEEASVPTAGVRIARMLALTAAVLMVILALFLSARLLITAGNSAASRLGSFGFLAGFFADMGEILNLLVSSLVAIAGGAIVSGFLGRLGRNLFDNVSRSGKFIMNLVLGALAGAVLFVLIMQTLNWFYQFNDQMTTLVWPALLGAFAGILVAFRTRKVDVLPVGLVVYYVTRTTLNALRAVEALIMVIVFAVWVGIGPFAGVLALSLHTIAALAKLYSEQVESISTGPMEAVKATGATRLQTIIYAVIPQIVPPYISFTMYRWDINVRMSTIIGFAGGGGIGFLLQQNINLLNYRAAAAQMLAIAIVVAMMDFLSSYMREKVV